MRMISRRAFLRWSLGGVAAATGGSFVAAACLTRGFFGAAIKALRFHGIEAMASLFSSGHSRISALSIRTDYEQGRFQELDGYFVADAEVLNQVLDRKARP